jgi:hypothetical protein
MHCQVKHPIDMTPDAPLPNGIVYHRSLMENEEIKHQIQELLQKGHIRPKSSPLQKPDCTGAEEGQDLATLH